VLPLDLLREGAQRAHDGLHQRLALARLRGRVDDARPGEAGVAPVLVHLLPHQAFLVARQALRGEVVARHLAQARLRRVVDRADELQPLGGLEALGEARRLEPARELLERLQLLRRQRLEQAARLLGVRHRMIGLAPGEQIQHLLSLARKS
jgi:hypothetical protein